MNFYIRETHIREAMAILIKNKDSRLYTTVYPNAGKETVILLHGGPGVPENLSPIAEFLARDFQVIYFHQRGTLNSPCLSGSYSMACYISDIDAVAAHFNLQQFHLFGHSWGGLYAQIYAQERQEKMLSMFSCSPASGTGLQWIETAMEIKRFNKKKATQQEWSAMKKNALWGMLGSFSAYQKFYTQLSINCNRDYKVKNPVQLMINHLNVWPINRTNISLLLYNKLKQLLNPGFKITVVYGDDDIYGDSPKYVRDRYPSAVFTTIPASSHFPWLHNEEAFFMVLADHFSVARPQSVTFKV